MRPTRTASDHVPMIPLRSHARVETKPLVTWLLITLCTGVMARLAWLDDANASDLMYRLAVVPIRLTADSLGESLTVLTSLFLHAGWLHLAGNMLFLAVFGPVIEARFGHAKFAGLYTASGITATVAFVATHPTSSVPLVGASGAIAGILGAHLVLAPRTQITTLVPAFVIVEFATLPAAFVIAVWFLLQVAATVAPVTSATQGAGVAWLAHVAGFACGVMCAFAVAWRPSRHHAGRSKRTSTQRKSTRRSA